MLLAAVALSAAIPPPSREAAPWSSSVPASLEAAGGATVEPEASDGRAATVTGTDRHLAPDGRDRGAGTEDAPWRTLAFAASRLQPGDVLWVHGGTYEEIEVSWSAAGTAEAPIVVRGVPGEQPVFDGGGTEDRFLWLHDGAGWLTFRDLVITGYATANTGVIVLSEGAHDVSLKGLEINGRAGGTQLDHLIYLSAPGVHDVTIEGCRLIGASGAAVHVYHAPGARRVQIIDNVVEGGRWGVLLYSGASDVLVRGNQFVATFIAVKMERATDVRLVGNRATGQFGIVVVGPPVEASYVDEGNAWPAPMELQAPT